MNRRGKIVIGEGKLYVFRIYHGAFHVVQQAKMGPNVTTHGSNTLPTLHPILLDVILPILSKGGAQSNVFCDFHGVFHLFRLQKCVVN